MEALSEGEYENSFRSGIRPSSTEFQTHRGRYVVVDEQSEADYSLVGENFCKALRIPFDIDIFAKKSQSVEQEMFGSDNYYTAFIGFSVTNRALVGASNDDYLLFATVIIKARVYMWVVHR